MAVQLTFFLILLASMASTSPVPQFRDVASNGPSGVLNVERRWRDTVGTAVQIFMNGPAGKNTVLHTFRTGPLSAVYRDALSTVRRPCEITDDHQCEIAVNGFGTVGEVHYDFIDAIRNTVGRSTQVMVACRCVDKECEKAVLIRPISVFNKPPSDPDQRPDQRTCLYESMGNGYSDCHTEVLRSVRRPIQSRRVEYTHGEDPFIYNVDQPTLQANWSARGQRGWTRDCLESEINSLKTVTIGDLKDNIQRKEHATPANNGCKPPNDFIQYVREEDPEAGEACYATYEYASASASYIASQQDNIAIGNAEDSYVHPRPPLISDTELALSCSAAGLGVLFIWDVFRKQLKKTNTSAFYLCTVIVIQIFSFALEALPLHMALGLEIDARGWRSEFAFIDGSVALASDQPSPQGSAEGSVLILTAVLGVVRYESTRVILVAGFSVMFDVIALGIIVATFVKKKQYLEQRKATGKKDRNETGWMHHLVGLRSREVQRQRMQQLASHATVLQARALSRFQNDGNAYTSSRRDEFADMSTESLNPNVSSITVSGDIAGDIAGDVWSYPVGFSKSPDTESGVHRRNSSSSLQTTDLEDETHNSRRTTTQQHSSDFRNDGSHSMK